MEVIMKYKIVVSLILILALAGGCSSQNSNNSESAKGGNTPKETVDKESNGSKEEISSESYTYIDEAGRELNFDQAPTRIVATYLPLWESLILLDIAPVGVSGADNYLATWDPFEGMDLGEVQDVGSEEVNLEMVAELEPDLILNQTYDINAYDIENLDKITTVAVFGPKSKMDWKLSLREVAKVVGVPEKAEEIIEEVQEKLDLSREKLRQGYAEKTVMQMSLMGVDRFFITYRPELYSEEGLGLTPPKGFTKETSYEQISMEALVEMNPDVIFVNVFDGDEAMFEEFQENPVWQTLTAVQNKQVFRLDGSGHALSGLSTIYTVDKIVDILQNQNEHEE